MSVHDDRSRILDDERKGLCILGARHVRAHTRVAGAWTSEGDRDA